MDLMTKARQSNFELLRIAAMVMIVGHHLVYHGIMHPWGWPQAYVLWAQGSLVNRVSACLLYPGGQVGVALFFMLTGYFCCERTKVSARRVVLQTALYLVLTTVLCAPFLADTISVGGWITTVLRVAFPATGDCYWFVTAYVALLVLVPLVNKLLARLSDRGFRLVLVLYGILWYALDYMSPFYGVLKGLFFYALGAYLRRNGARGSASGQASKSIRNVLLVGAFVLGWVLFAAIQYVIAALGAAEPGAHELGTWALDLAARAVAVPLCAVSLFQLFATLDIGSVPAINTLAACMFGVYLIHDAPFVRPLLWQRLLRADSALYLNVLFPLLALLCVAAIVAVCALIDRLRARFVEPPMLAAANRVLDALVRAVCKR